MGNVEALEPWREALQQNSERVLARTSDALAASASMSDSPTDEPALLLEHASWAHATRRVDRARARRFLTEASPSPGDLVLARVDALGHHANLQLTDGRRRRLFPGDLIVVAYGHRYACEQFEAEVPSSLGPCHLVAGGGIASRAVSWHDRISRGPTRITPLALLADDSGAALNLAGFRIEARPGPARRPQVLAVLGTAMDAGKTQTAAFLTRGLRAAGHRTGYLKVTGTGAGGDTWLLHDAGADRVLDFTDAGLASTYLAPMDAIESAILTLLDDMAAHDIDVVVMEVADGVYQRETAALIRSDAFRACVDGIVLAGRDAMGVGAGVAALTPPPAPLLAVSGLLSASPLQRREAETATALPTLNREELARADTARELLAAAVGSVEARCAREAG